MTIKALYPTIRPSLDLNFARTRALDPRITYTRASTGTFVGSNGLVQTAASGVPRFDFNPTTGESLGLLVEEARTNIALYSEQFDSGYWQGTTFDRTSNAAVAPDGTATADKLTPSNGTSSNNFTVSRSFTGLSGSTTGSFYVKSAGHRYARIAGYVLDLLSTQNGQYSVYVGNGWHRIYHVIEVASFDFGVNITAATPGQGFTGNGVDGIFIWGAQVEAGSFPTSYIPTVASTVTRAADVASMTGANFSSWYNQNEGTFAATMSLKSNAAYPILFETYNASTLSLSGGFGIFADIPGSGLEAVNQATGAGKRIASYPSIATNSNKISTAYGASTGLALNGNVSTVSTSYGPTSGTISGIQFLQRGVFYTGTIARLAYYPSRLPDAQLQVLTQ